ncbi:hypothetical protein HD554DRAFT_2175502 [Boletus coccyginus]|nr:hypothetical protein HD554DRAFT_2175502 [Boletus coccyginus]
MSWFYNSTSQKSLNNLNHLIHEVILANNFNLNNLHQFNAQHEIRQLDDTPSNTSLSFSTSDSWHTTFVFIQLPYDKVKQVEDAAPKFQVEGLYYQKITDVIRFAFEELAAHAFHHVLYKLFW